MTTKNSNTDSIKAGEELRKIRNKLGYSLKEVAKNINITTGYLGRIERGEKDPSEIVMDSLASFYKIDRIEIFDFYNKFPPEHVVAWLENEDLRKLLTNISLDERLNDSDRTQLLNQVQETYRKLLEEKEKG